MRKLVVRTLSAPAERTLSTIPGRVPSLAALRPGRTFSRTGPAEA